MFFVFVQDRESGEWRHAGTTTWYTTTEYPHLHSRRGKKVRRQDKYIYPKPENVSAFIKAHKIIEALTKEEACQKLNSK